MKFAAVLIISFAVFLLLILVVGKNRILPKIVATPSPSYLPLPSHVFNSNSPCTTERDKIIFFVTNFEILQTKQDSSGVLRLFTSPISGDDKKTYDFLLKELYTSQQTMFKMASYKITELPDEYLKGGCLLTVVEQRSMPGTSGFGQVKPFSVDIIVVKENDQWKIDKYFQSTQVPTKYSGWN